MSDVVRHTPGLSTCGCTECMLVRCGAIDADWDGWREVHFAGEMRMAMMQLTRQEPVCYSGPRRRWEGALDWFRVLGLALDFDDDEGDDDESA